LSKFPLEKKVLNPAKKNDKRGEPQQRPTAKKKKMGQEAVQAGWTNPEPPLLDKKEAGEQKGLNGSTTGTTRCSPRSLLRSPLREALETNVKKKKNRIPEHYPKTSNCPPMIQ